MKHFILALLLFPVVGNAQVITNAEWNVREAFRDTPILSIIASCESGYRHFDEQNKVLKGKENPDDIGVMQINRKYHEKEAYRLGFDIYTFEGNIGYARYLYDTQGTAPWVHSSKCWKGQIAPA
jgi:hypothetical protein